MRTGDLYRGLIAVPCQPSYAVQRQRSRSYGLSVLVRDSQTHIDRPPVVDERRDTRHHLASLPVVGGETGPCPLVLQLVEVVFRVPAVPVVLRDSPHLVLQRGHQHGVLIQYAPIRRFGQIQGQLFGRLLFGLLLLRDSFAQWSSQHHYAPFLGPSAQLQLRVQTLPLLPCIHPLVVAH